MLTLESYIQSCLGSRCPHYSISFHSPWANKDRFSVQLHIVLVPSKAHVSTNCMCSFPIFSIFIYVRFLPRHPFVKQHARVWHKYRTGHITSIGVFRFEWTWINHTDSGEPQNMTFLWYKERWCMFCSVACGGPWIIYHRHQEVECFMFKIPLRMLAVLGVWWNSTSWMKANKTFFSPINIGHFALPSDMKHWRISWNGSLIMRHPRPLSSCLQ